MPKHNYKETQHVKAENVVLKARVEQTTTLSTNELKRQNQQVHQLNSLLVCIP